MIRPLQIGKRILGFNFVDPYHGFNRTTCTRVYFTLEIFWPDPEISDPIPGFGLKCFSFLFLGSCVSLPLFGLGGMKIITFCGCPRVSSTCNTLRNVEMDRQAVTRCNKRTRLRPFDFRGVISTHSSTTRGTRSQLIFFHMHPLFFFERCVPSHVHCVGSGWRQSSLQRVCNWWCPKLFRKVLTRIQQKFARRILEGAWLRPDATGNEMKRVSNGRVRGRCEAELTSPYSIRFHATLNSAGIQISTTIPQNLSMNSHRILWTWAFRDSRSAGVSRMSGFNRMEVVLTQDGLSRRWRALLTKRSVCTRRPQILHSISLTGTNCRVHLPRRCRRKFWRVTWWTGPWVRRRELRRIANRAKVWRHLRIILHRIHGRHTGHTIHGRGWKWYAINTFEHTLHSEWPPWRCGQSYCAAHCAPNVIETVVAEFFGSMNDFLTRKCSSNFETARATRPALGRLVLAKSFRQVRVRGKVQNLFRCESTSLRTCSPAAWAARYNKWRFASSSGRDPTCRASPGGAREPTWSDEAWNRGKASIVQGEPVGGDQSSRK